MSAAGAKGRLTGKRVLLTGASSGLGAHFARVLARSGCAELVLAARRRDRLEALARELAFKSTSFGPAAPDVHVIELDVSDPGSVTRAFERVDTLLRGAAVDVVINNAGSAGVPKRLLAGAVHDFDAVMATNVRGSLLVTQAAARRLIAAKQGGSIVNIASILAAQPSQGNAFYATSKAALVALTRASALELLPSGIRVNAILPGYIQTEMNESFFQSPRGRQFVEERLLPKRLGSPSDLDGPLMLLCSDESSFMTGSQIVADGGSLLFPL
jgi:NAD(P)-dependent dehydrogenase (short-subunit alcohol dehydrogenase family)